MKAEQSDIVGEVRKIVVLRPNALGDFVFCLPALHALKLRYPEAHITFIGKQWHAEFLDGRPGPIDEVVVMPPFPGIGAPVASPAVDTFSMKDEKARAFASRRDAGASCGNSAAVAGVSAPAMAGESGAAMAGESGAAMAGESGAAITGESGAAISGESRAAITGESGAAIAGESGGAMAGENLAAVAGENSAALAGENGAAKAGAQKISHARAAFIERMRAEHFDLAIQIYGGGGFANPLVKQFAARYCLGMRAADAEPLDRWLAFDGVVNKRLQLLEVAALADAAYWPMQARLHVTTRDRDAAAACIANSVLVPPLRVPFPAALVRSADVRPSDVPFAYPPSAAAPGIFHTDAAPHTAGASSGTAASLSPFVNHFISQGPLVLLQPGSTDPRRCWPAQKFALLGDALAARGARIYINGTAEESALVASIVADMHYPATDLSGKASLPALCGLIELCSLVVSNDTGPLHLALEIGTPAVGIYWLTNLIESAPLRQQGHRAAVSLQVHCSVCGAENITTRCAHDSSFVADVGLEEVLAHALALLEVQ